MRLILGRLVGFLWKGLYNKDLYYFFKNNIKQNKEKIKSDQI